MCNHKFIKLAEISKPVYDSWPSNQNESYRTPSPSRSTAGATIVCAECGEVRYVYEDGKIIITNNGQQRE